MTAIGHSGDKPDAGIERPRRSDGVDGSPGARSRLAAALAKGRGLADALAQEVQLRAADLAVAEDLDLVDARAVDLEGPLDADARTRCAGP